MKERAKWFTKLPKEEQKAIENREKDYREQLLKKYLEDQKNKNQEKNESKSQDEQQ